MYVNTIFLLASRCNFLLFFVNFFLIIVSFFIYTALFRLPVLSRWICNFVKKICIASLELQLVNVHFLVQKTQKHGYIFAIPHDMNTVYSEIFFYHSFVFVFFGCWGNGFVKKYWNQRVAEDRFKYGYNFGTRA